ncbi:MAG TPA: DUF1559 domain-containing protein [Pirellulales bacterium]|jgi:hypothetical protein|nr:DUF1559 domain-containing protein [Pirellulales bacterium]
MPRKLLTTLFLGIVLASGAIGFAAESAGNKLDLSFVPAEAFAISVIQPQRIFTGPLAPVCASIMNMAGGKEKIGFDPGEIEQAMMILGLQPDAAANPNKPPRIGFVIRFVSDVDQLAWAAKIVPHGTDGTVEGRKARVNANDYAMSCLFADAKTLLIANQPDLQWLLRAKPGDSPLRKLAASADDSPEWQLLLAVEPLRPVVAPAFAEAAQQYPRLAALPKLPTLANSVTANLRQMPQGAAMQFDVIAATPDDAAAKELTDDIKELLDVVKNQLIEGMQTGARAAGSAGGPPPAVINQMQMMSNKVVAALQPTQEGKQVKIHTDIQSGPATIGMAVALILPAVQAAREAAHRTEDSNNLKQLGLALLNYADANKRLPARAIFDKDGKPLLSWRVMILPYLEENELYKQFHLDEPWDSEHNKTLIEKMPDAYKHPEFNEPGKTLYVVPVGKGLAFEGTEGLRLKDFTDGLSNTIMLVEAAPAKAVPWTKPEDWSPDDNNPMKDLGGLFAGNIVNIGFADCHVDGISKDIDAAVFKALLTRSGGEKIPQ